MLLILIIILVLIGSAVISSIYSNFSAFYLNFQESENYHRAYYAAISALERGELVIKQRYPGYVGSGGFIVGIGQGSILSGGSDGSLSGFSYFGEEDSNSTVFWDINSRATRIPSTGGGNVEGSFASNDSKDYNMMNYQNSEVFLLYYDNSTGNPYQGGSINRANPDKVEGVIRLPQQLSGFGELNTGLSLVGRPGQVPNDDAIVDWQIKGITNNNKPYTIYSTQKIAGSKVSYQNDTIFRESDINNPLAFEYDTNWNPISNSTNSHGSNSPITIISEDEDTIKTYGNFKTLFSSVNNAQIRLSLLNLLESINNNIYPFLEYYIDFGSEVSDKYYTINAEGEFDDYQVKILIQKPTFKESIFSNFTSIF